MEKFRKKNLSASSKNWIQRHKNNSYNHKNNQAPSRSFFKIEEIHNKYRIFKKDYSVLDLGCCPGGWSAFAKKFTEKIHGCDLLDNMKINIEKFILGDFTDVNIQSMFGEYHNIICDIASNSTGNKWIDNTRNHEIAEQTWEFTKKHLIKNGNFVIKIFESEYTHHYVNEIKKFFYKVDKFKPKSSYKDSSEIYLVCIKYNQDLIKITN